MARHRVPVQAFRNFLSILLGFALGGLNNLVVLPWAFGDDLASWGLVRVAAAWGTLLGPILAFGASSSMNRFKGRCGRGRDPSPTLGTLVAPGFVLFLASSSPCRPAFPGDHRRPAGIGRKQPDAAVRPIALLAGLQTAQIYFIGFLTSRLKTALATFAKETLFKVGYLLLARPGRRVASAPSRNSSPPSSVSTSSFSPSSSRKRWRTGSASMVGAWGPGIPAFTSPYGATMILGNSAWAILNQIDIIMVGRLMSTEWVPLFAIASFIATVTQIPNRAITRLWQPLIAEAMDRKDHDRGLAARPMTHRTLLLTSGWILACITACLPELDHLLPDAFHGLGAVIFTVGCFRVMQGSAAGSAILIGQSDHFRTLIALNWTMVALAIPLNLDDSGFRARPRPSRRRPRHPHRHGHLHHLPTMGRLADLETVVHPRPGSLGIVLCLAVPAGLLMVRTPGLQIPPLSPCSSKVWA